MKKKPADLLLVESMFENTSFDTDKKAEIVRLTGDASTRRYYRINTTSKSYVACLDTPSSNDSAPPFLEMHKLLEDHKVCVPQIFTAEHEKGFILEEDLGDVTLLKHMALINSKEEEFSLYKQAIDNLFSIHNTPLSEFKKTSLGELSFDKEKLFSEMVFTFKYFTQFLRAKCSAKQTKEILKPLSDICELIASFPKVLTHRDYHSRNIMLKNNEFKIIDFQDARAGIPQYDLVSLLEDSYYQISSENLNSLKKYYWDNFKNQNFFNNYEHFLEIYDVVAIQRIFKAIGSFCYIYETRGDFRYLKYIGYSFEKLKSILLNYNEYNDLRKNLTSIYYEY